MAERTPHGLPPHSKLRGLNGAVQTDAWHDRSRCHTALAQMLRTGSLPLHLQRARHHRPPFARPHGGAQIVAEGVSLVGGVVVGFILRMWLFAELSWVVRVVACLWFV